MPVSGLGATASARVVSRVTSRRDGKRSGASAISIAAGGWASPQARSTSAHDAIASRAIRRIIGGFYRGVAGTFAKVHRMSGQVAEDDGVGAIGLSGELLAEARALLPWMVEVRRDLHRHPELGLDEHRTSARVQALLAELGVPFVGGLAGTGVLGTIRGESEGHVVALRADLDALPLQDAKDVPYRSEIPGRMHACGHDVHTTVLLGAARLLRDRLRGRAGTVKLIFQPAEETVGGARLLVEQGVLESPRVDAIFGLHVDPGLPVGHVGLKYGQRNASSDDVAITIHGRSCHGAYPAAGVDAIVVAAQVVTALQTVVSRNVDARASAVVTIGTIAGGRRAISWRRACAWSARCAPSIAPFASWSCSAFARSRRGSRAGSERAPRCRSTRATTR